MSEHRHKRLTEAIKQHAANFLEHESNRQSLITVTNARLSSDIKHIEILLSVYPETQEAVACSFAKRRVADFRTYLKQHARLKFIPRITFELDQGEKNRRRVEELLQQ